MTLLWPFGVPGELAAHEIAVWAWTFGITEQDMERDAVLLSDDERQRMNRFYFLRHRIQFATCHANLRRILGFYLGCDTSSLKFAIGPFGKPTVDAVIFKEHVANQISFNLTHTATVGVLAVASEIEVGVDAEVIRPIGPDVAETHFSSRELGDLNTLSGDAWLNAFYTIWTRKEALLKAEGVGLNLPLADFDVSVLPHCDPALVGSRPAGLFNHSWQLRHLIPADGVIGALAMSRKPSRVTCLSYQAES